MEGNLYNNAGRVIGGYAAHNIAVVGEGMVDAHVQQLFLTGVGGRAQNDVDGAGPDENSYRYLDIPGYGRTRPGVLALSNSVNVSIQLANSHGWTSAYILQLHQRADLWRENLRRLASAQQRWH